MSAPEAVAGEYAQALGFAIALHSPSWGYGRLRRDGQLHVHLHALPVRPLRLALLSKTSTARLPLVLGHRLVEGSRAAYAPPGRLSRGMTLTDEDGSPVLHLLLNNLYILFDLAGQPDALAPLLLRKSLDLALPRLQDWAVEVAAVPAPRFKVLLTRLGRDTAREAGDLLCRWDTWRPERRTMTGIPVVLPEEPLWRARAQALRETTWREMVEKVSVVSRVVYPDPIEAQAFELEFIRRLDEG